MNHEIAKLIDEAKRWLAVQRPQIAESPEWYTFGNFRSFISSLESDHSEQSITRAVHSLRHHITDQYEWSAEYCKTISQFCDHADKIGKEMLRANE